MKNLQISNNPSSAYGNKSDILAIYYKELNKNKKLLTIDDEIELCKLIKEGDLKAKDKLVLGNMRFVVSVAKQYMHIKGVDLIDLINEGNIGLINAAVRFDSTRGFKFISYAVFSIRERIMNYLNHNSKIFRLPLNKIKLYSKITKKIQEIEQNFNSMNISDDLINYFSESDIQQYHEYNNVSNVMNINNHMGEDGTDFTETIKCNTMDPLDELISNERKDILYQAIDTLSYNEQQVMYLYYGLKDNDILNKNEISKKLDLYIGQVSSILYKASRKIKIFIEKATNVTVKIKLSKSDLFRLKREDNLNYDFKNKIKSDSIKEKYYNDRDKIFNKYITL
jgi:RNA polymerase primary sigma factor